MMYWIIIRLARCLAKIFYQHKVYGKEHIEPGAAIIAPNHVSFLDPPITAVSTPQNVYFLARKTLFKGWFGKFIYALNARPVSEGNANIQIFKDIGALLQEGKKVILFPEGTRSIDGAIGDIKPGIYLLFHRTHCPIQPVYLVGTQSIWGKGQKLPKLFGRTACVFGSPVLWEHYREMERKEVQERFATDLRQAILSLKNWYEQGAKGTPP
ncbi:MAG: 1-acyl-sn-glycerol-3-phosphate acyltransferase [Simkania sp.]|nr:1-acyl-sn-glycerol-3-phosphate acyltransferase [Simkania sp.]